MEPPTTSSFRLGYRAELDGFRAVAILMVVFQHLRMFPEFLQETPFYPGGGFLGVNLFFVLSGFLITVLLHQEYARWGKVNLKHFYGRRILRLYPALLVLIVVIALGAWSMSSFPVLVRWKSGNDWIYALFYLSNYAMAFNWMLPQSPYSPTWSLAVEEHFYIVWPTLYILSLRLRSRPRSLALLLGCSILAVTGYRAWAVTQVPWIIPYRTTHTRIDSILWGCLLGILIVENLLSARAVKSIVFLRWPCALAVIAFFIFGRPVPDVVGIGIFGYDLCCTVLIGGCVLKPEGNLVTLLSLPPMVYIGKLSYSLYLWHWPFHILRTNPRGSFVDALPVFLLALLFSVISFHFVERPFLRVKNKYFGSKTKS